MSSLSAGERRRVSFVIESFGVRIRIAVNHEAWLERIRERLPPGWSAETGTSDWICALDVSGTGSQSSYSISSAFSVLLRTDNQDAALDAFESAVRLAVATRARRWLFVHAGVVGWKGRALLLPASSTHGKSQLVEALVRAGATYYSDEFAPLDRAGRVHPFAKPLTLRLPEGGVRRVLPGELGGTAGDEPLPVGVVISTQYVSGARWSPRVGGSGDAVLALLAHTTRARIDPAQSLHTLSTAASGRRLLDGFRGEARDVAQHMLSLAEEQYA